MGAVEAVLVGGGPRTPDLGGAAGTAEVARAVAGALEGPTAPRAPAPASVRAGAATDPLAAVRALTFDVFGTVVDWYGGLVREGQEIGRRLGIDVDWPELAVAWRGRYRPTMARVRSGELPPLGFLDLHRVTLDEVLAERGIDLPDAETEAYSGVWRRLDPWPDSPLGLRRLGASYVVSTLSNGGVGLLTALAKRGDLRFDCILSSELFRTYKPDPTVYLGAAELLDLRPEQVMMVAAHSYDLEAARELGLRTAFVERAREYGPTVPHPDLPPAPDHDVVAGDLEDLASQLQARPRA
jgi:2-haloacid dehalogenase